MLVNQRGPRQLQRPLGQAPLATTYKDADLRHASQSQLRFHRDKLSGTQTARASLLAADARKTGGSQPFGRQRKGDRPARSQPAADARKTDELACYSRSFTGIRRTRPTLELRPFSGPRTPHRLTHTLPACLPVCSSICFSNSNKYLF
jgi:hypothetical protein